MPDPLVSVVVSTRDRPARLGRLLAGLGAQSLGPEAFEVVVVDDGSPPQTRAVIEAAPVAVRTIRNETPRGPGAGRNRGWRAAGGALVAFTDDDCVPDREWLQAALAVSETAPGAIVQGRTEPDPTEAEHAGVLSRTIRVEALGPQYETCNIFYPRALLEALGGFDEGFGLSPGGEDTDLGWRAIEAGSATVFAPGAVVFHAVQPLGVRGMLRVAARWSDVVRLFADHPPLRATLYRRVFWNVWHYLLWRSALTLLAPRWLRRMLVTRHLLELRKRARAENAGSWAVPFLAVHDLVECWSVARGAVRYRTLVL
ncbi:MAG TPA: glycosyltransferase [Solirubrobacteraceae bacterium]|nr:glycosyltransferase [Solirubrobacteraceae bacterium]